jgi:hypothetical protein
MKGKGRVIIIAIFTAIIISGCSSGPTIIDSSVPLELSSTLIIRKCAVVEFNGRATGWGPFDLKWGIMGGDRQVIIPSGTHTLIVYHSVDGGPLGRTQRWTGTTTFEFKPGRTYIVTMPSGPSPSRARITLQE